MIDQNLENKFERKKETIEFYVANPSDYRGFQTMLRSLDPNSYDVKIIAGPSEKILPAIVRKDISGPLGYVAGPREYYGEQYVQEALNFILQNSRHRAKKVAK